MSDTQQKLADIAASVATFTTEATNLTDRVDTIVTQAETSVTESTSQADKAESEAALASGYRQGVSDEGDTQTARVLNEGDTQDARVLSEGNTQSARVQADGDTQSNRVQSEGNAQTTRVSDEGATQTVRVQDQGASQVALIQSEGDTQTNRVQFEGGTQEARVIAEGGTQVSRVTAEGDTQTAQVLTEGNTQAARSGVEADRAATEANRSDTEADRSTTQANRSEGEADRSESYVQGVLDQGDTQTARVLSEGNTQVARVVAEGDIQTARAEADADRSKTEADKAISANASAQTALTATEQARDTTVAVATNGDGSLTSEAGKYAIADAEGKFDHQWLKPIGVPTPDFHLPLVNDLHIKEGVGVSTFSRASTATYINKQGLLIEAGIEEPRFEKEGVLIEGASTNLAVESHAERGNGAFDSAVTFLDGQPSIRLARDTEQNSNNITWGGASPSLSVNQTTPVTISMYVKRDISSALPKMLTTARRFGADGTQHIVDATLDLNTMTASSNMWWKGSVKEVGNGWYRWSITTVEFEGYHNCSTGSPYLRGWANVQVGDAVNVGGYQVEELPFASSYIPTDGAPATRAADYVSVPSVTSDPSDNTVYAEISFMGYLRSWAEILTGVMPGYRWESSSLASTNSQSLAAYRNYIKGDGTSYHIGVLLCVDFTAKETWKLAVVSEGENFIGYEGGVTSTTTEGILPAPNTQNLSLGRDGAAFFHIKNIRIWNHALSPEQIYNL